MARKRTRNSYPGLFSYDYWTANYNPSGLLMDATVFIGGLFLLLGLFHGRLTGTPPSTDQYGNPIDYN